MASKKKKKEQEEETLVVFPDLFQDQGPRMTGIYGEIEEEKCKAALASLYQLKTSPPPIEGEDPLPIDFIISSEGGNVPDMFAVYDSIRDVRNVCEVHTYGLGKVMSAGILLLASGTKGKRKVGKYCRLMMHSVQGGQFGCIKELEVDLREIRWYQDQFIKALESETNLDLKELKKIFQSPTDTYFDAEQAVKWGIADEVV